jgi:hypothetical protein
MASVDDIYKRVYTYDANNRLDSANYPGNETVRPLRSAQADSASDQALAKADCCGFNRWSWSDWDLREKSFPENANFCPVSRLYSREPDFGKRRDLPSVNL